MNRRRWLLWLPLLLGLVGCTRPEMRALPVHAGAAGSLTPAPTATATPLRPLPPTPTYLPSPTPTGTPTPLPTPTPIPTATPTLLVYGPPQQAAPPLTELEGRVNLILLGSDRRPGHTDFRTDAMIFVSYNPATGATLMASFPRDLYVFIPGVGYNRINTAMEFGGFDTLAATLTYNFGIRPEHYILVNFSGFEDLVDTLGGLDVQVTQPLCDPLNCVSPGLVHMDGAQALWYARSRITTSDFDRARRQQEILVALSDKLLSPDALRQAPELYKTLKDMVETDLTLLDVASLAAKAGRFSPDAISRVVFAPPRYGAPWITPQGWYVVLPNVAAIQGALRALAR